MPTIKEQLQQASKDSTRHILFDEFQKVSFSVQMLNGIVQNDYVRISPEQTAEGLLEVDRIKEALNTVVEATTKFLVEEQNAQSNKPNGMCARCG